MSLTPTKAQQAADRDRAFADLRERVDALVDERDKGVKHAELLARELKVVHKEKNDLRGQRDAALNRVRELETDPLFGALQEMADGWMDRATTAERLVVELGQLARHPHALSSDGRRCLWYSAQLLPEARRECDCGAAEINAKVASLLAQLPAPVVQSIQTCEACSKNDHARCTGWCSCHLTGCPGDAT